MTQSKPRDNYRYTVEVDGESVTPLASAHCYIGEEVFRILNISGGGLALLLNAENKWAVGDRFSVSIEIRGRSFAVEVEIKGIQSLRVNCQFMNPSRIFQGALREFLQPKFLGEGLKRSEHLSSVSEVLSLVESAKVYEAYLGQNQSGFFVWMADDRRLLKIVGVSADLIFEWSLEQGLKTGHLPPKLAGQNNDLLLKGGDSQIQWSRFPEQALLHYFADIMLAWLHLVNGREFVDDLFNDREVNAGREILIAFPKPL
jgi:hypothetical protein